MDQGAATIIPSQGLTLGQTCLKINKNGTGDFVEFEGERLDDDRFRWILLSRCQSRDVLASGC